MLLATQPIVENKNMIAAEKLDAEITEEYKKIREIERRITKKRIERNRLPSTKRQILIAQKFIKACPDERCRGFPQQPMEMRYL